MAITENLQFHTEQGVSNDILQDAVKVLQGKSAPDHFVIGPHIQDPHSLHVTAEWSSATESETEGKSSSLETTLQSIFGNPTSTFQIHYNIDSAFQSNGPATSPVVEYVQSWFPVSRLTDDFRKQIEADFNKFNSILNSDGLHAGREKLGYGWTGPASHPDIPGEEARAFTVTCGWDKMSSFEESLKTEAFGRAIPTLFAWGAPYKMWHVESQVRDDIGA